MCVAARPSARRRTTRNPAYRCSHVSLRLRTLPEKGQKHPTIASAMSRRSRSATSARRVFHHLGKRATSVCLLRQCHLVSQTECLSTFPQPFVCMAKGRQLRRKLDGVMNPYLRHTGGFPSRTSGDGRRRAVLHDTLSSTHLSPGGMSSTFHTNTCREKAKAGVRKPEGRQATSRCQAAEAELYGRSLLPRPYLGTIRTWRPAGSRPRARDRTLS